MLTFTVLLLFASLFNGVFSSAVRSFESLEVFPGGARYSVDSTVLLNDVARKNRETGYKIKAELNVEPIWSHGDEEFLLRFDLFSPKLHLRGKHVSAEFLPHKSEWDSHRSRPFYAHWNKGIIENVYVEPDEPLDFVNFKKSLVSLFQFQILDGEFTETDISGTCDVMYESLSIDVIRKFKRRCTWQGIVSSDSATDQQGLDAPLPVRRVHRIELGEGLKGVKSIMAEDAAAAARGAGVGVKARAFIRLHQIGSAPSPKPRPSLADAIPAGMNQEKLPLTPPKEEVKPVDLRSALAPHRSALEASEAAGGGGGAAVARAALRLIPAFRAASKEALVKEMEDPANGEILTALVRLLGVTASPASHSAAHTHLQLARKAAGDLPHKYLSAVPRAHNVQDSVTLELLRLASIAREPAVADSALLAAAAAAAGGAGGVGDVGKTVAEGLAKERAKCKDDACRSTRLLALGSLRRPDSLPLLLQAAAASPGSAAAALTAVAKVAEVQPLTAQQMERVRRIAMQLDKPYPLEVRAQAIDLLLSQAAAQSTARGLDLLPCRLQALAGGLARAGEGDAELRRFMWQRMEALSEEHKGVKPHGDVVRRSEPSLYHYYHPGTTSVLSRWAGADSGYSLTLHSAQLASHGVLRHGTVTLQAKTPRNTTHDLITIDLWATGLANLAGTSKNEDSEAEDVAAGLAVHAGGAFSKGVTLFNGQAELLSAVWAGTGSEPTPVLRATIELPYADDKLPLSTGVLVKRSWHSVLVLALDAHATVSLWGRNAKTGTELRAAGVVEASIDLSTMWGDVKAEASYEAEPKMDIHADLDFYDQVALCVRTVIDEFEFRRNITLTERLGSTRRLLRRASAGAARGAGGGRTLALGQENDRACRILTPAA